MGNFLGKKVKVEWRDAVFYSEGYLPKSLTKMITLGILEKHESDYILIKNPKTFRKDISLYQRIRKIFNLKKQPTYFFIPKGMIEKITDI